MHSQNYSLLFVDDQEEHLHVYSMLFEKWGYRVTTLRQAADVFDVISKEHFDILVIDIQLPSISGIDVIKQIRNERRFDRIPIIALTASQLDRKDEIIAAGATNFCLKDNVSTKLQSQIANALAGVSEGMHSGPISD